MKFGLFFSVASLLAFVSTASAQTDPDIDLEVTTTATAPPEVTVAPELEVTQPEPEEAAAPASNTNSNGNSNGNSNSNGQGTNSANQGVNQYTDRFEDGLTNTKCHDELIQFDPFVHKPVYTVGVHAIRGFQAGRAENQDLFEEYLTKTVGRRFEPPIEFKMVGSLFEDAEDHLNMDLFYSSPGIFSCIGVETGATALATAIKRLEVRNKILDLDTFGGVMMVLANNHEINQIEDLKDKIIGAYGINSLMAGQMQIYEMFRHGMSYVNDPKQVVFTQNLNDVVKGVLDGTYEVGFVRTEQIEISKDENGDPLDQDLFKIIEPKVNIMDNGDVFPLLHSTDIFAEWPVASRPHVPPDVNQEVQESLLAFGKYARVGRLLEECIELNGEEFCHAKSPLDFDPTAPCDTTWPLAELALKASKSGFFSGFRTARSYFELQGIQLEAGFMAMDERNDLYCTRPANLYEGITCPEGFFRRDRQEFANGCAHVGLGCDAALNHTCFCKPCVEAYDVDVYEHDETDLDSDLHLLEFYGKTLPGCEKMSICASMEQGQSIGLRVYDNLMRDDAHVTAILHAGEVKKELLVERVKGAKYAYNFSVMDKTAGVQVVEVFIDGDPISQSPIRVMIEDRDCDAAFGNGSKLVADADGKCVCQSNTYQVGATCMDSAYFMLIIVAVVVIFFVGVLFTFLTYKKQQSDTVWHIGIDELQFDEPPEVIGQGGFGVVVLGVYRGTKVAVKRALPPSTERVRDGSTTGGVSDVLVSGEIRSTGGELEPGHQIVGDTRKKTHNKHDGRNSVSFEISAGDIEAQDSKTDGLTRQEKKAWNRFLQQNSKHNETLMILQSVSVGGRSGSTGVTTSKSMGKAFNQRLPLWMRFDKQAMLRKEFLNEMRLLSRLRHPCITTVMGAVIAPRTDPMLVMEFMDYGSLYDLIRNETMYLSGEILLQIIRDVVSGIQFLHSSSTPILHGDLKGKNILVDARFRAKVADFGFSHVSRSGGMNQVLRGTPFYMAPEYVSRRNEYTTCCDIYSLGMVLFEIYARQCPFEGEDPRVMLPKICNPRENKRPNIPPACPSKVAEVIKKTWSKNPFFRPTAKDIDYVLVEMSSKDAERIESEQEALLAGARKPATLYDVFPKHIAEALDAGKRVEPESHEMVTVLFSDIVGFTTISQTFSPLKVSHMLDRLFGSFDALAKKHSVFKVETIGDAYMGVTNLDGLQNESHVKNIAEFAVEMVEAASRILIDDEEPEKGNVKIRVGFHSGPVVSNVIGSLNPRYGLFGDTVNTASRMESNSVEGRIQMTHASAKLLETQAPEMPVKLRGKLNIKGKGKMITYWCGNPKKYDPTQLIMETPEYSEAMADVSEPTQNQEDKDDKEDNSSSSYDSAGSGLTGDTYIGSESSCNLKVDAVADILMNSIKELVASRPETINKRTIGEDQAIRTLEQFLGSGLTALEEQKSTESTFPTEAPPQSGRDPDTISLPSIVQEQVHQLVENIAENYKANKFHEFAHCVQVVQNAQKLLLRTQPTLEENLPMLAHDKLAHVALLFGALCHDVAHPGIPNYLLAKEDTALNEKYKGRALAEQNSFDFSWKLLMDKDYNELRSHLYLTSQELMRFRQVMIKSVLATEIFDPVVVQLQKDRWENAFGPASGQHKDSEGKRAYAAIELYIQASDIGHITQGWSTYTKWNKRLFKEMYVAYKAGRFPKDPAENWYESELKFFDSHVIPLCQRMCDCRLFGAVGEDSLKHAKSNRKVWETKGKAFVASMKKSVASSPKTIDELPILSVPLNDTLCPAAV